MFCTQEKNMLRCKLALALTICALSGVVSSAAEYGLKEGTPDIKHAGPLTFGPEGVLFIGDTLNAAVYAIDTEDTKATTSNPAVNIDGINQKIAAMVGTGPDETVINDMTVNPISGNLYLSVARGRGPDATPLIFKTDSKGNIAEVSLKKIKFSKAAFSNAPESTEGRRNPRLSAITDLKFTDGKVVVAGLSNEEFASTLRVLTFPFDGKAQSTSIEVYHGAHGKLETASPVRTFVTYENSVLAAYTCTPLVTIPVDDLKPGTKTKGKTIAELGNMNQPLDMIVYTKGEQDYLLMSNTARGVMKLKLSKSEINAAEEITTKIAGTAGLPYETLSDLKDVVQLAKLNSDHAVLLVKNGDRQDVRTINLP
jgi:hypothetical protein